jgi:hypothetical protein
MPSGCVSGGVTITSSVESTPNRENVSFVQLPPVMLLGSEVCVKLSCTCAAAFATFSAVLAVELAVLAVLCAALAVVFAAFAVVFAELAVVLAVLDVSIARFALWNARFARANAFLATAAALAPIEGIAQARASATPTIATNGQCRFLRTLFSSRLCHTESIRKDARLRQWLAPRLYPAPPWRLTGEPRST